MKLTQVHHVAIIASSLEKTKDFYVGKLGFEILREMCARTMSSSI